MPRSALWNTVVEVAGSSLISFSLRCPKGRWSTKKAAFRPPFSWHELPHSVGAVRHGLGAVAPDIDADEQKQPDHIDEVPVPGGEFEAEMLGRREMPGIGAHQADDQEHGSDQHVEAVETGRHEEGGAIDVAGEGERGMAVLVGLHAGEGGPEQDGEDEA